MQVWAFGYQEVRTGKTAGSRVAFIHFSAKVFHGKIEGIDDLVTFEGKSVDELIKAFHEEVDDYINLCKETGKEPMRSYKGGFNVRVTPEIHRRAVETAIKKGLQKNMKHP